MAIDMFLKLDTVEGETPDARHRGAIDVLGIAWGVARATPVHDTGEAGTTAGKVEVQDLRLTKHVDSSSPALFLLCCNGHHVKQAVLSVRKAGGLTFDYLKITMDDVLVTSVAIVEGGSERLTEEVTLNFGRCVIQYTPDRPDGSAGTPIKAGWDFRENAPI